MSMPLPENAALLLVDVQRGFDDPRWGARNNPDAEARIAWLADRFRASRRRVIHLWHDSAAPDGAFRADSSGHAPKPEGTPRPGERVYVKRVNSGFIGTTLEQDLRAEGIGTVVLVGFTTNHCVSTTARMAGNLGFSTVVVSDATAAFERATVDGRVRPAAEVHDGALSDLHGEFARVLTSAEVGLALGV
jgi:nicotinamidase-related amidase